MNRLQPWLEKTLQGISSTLPLRFQLGDCDRRATVVFGFVANAFDQRVRREKFGQAAPERTRPMAMNDADARLSRECSFVNEFVHAARGLFHGAADDIDFVGGGLVARLRAPGVAMRGA